jgi:Fe2+ transport system protein FeoA
VTLDQLPVGRTAVVARLVADAALRERLAELGFTTGARVRMRARALFGDPLQVVVRGGTFAVRSVEARCIQLDEDTVGIGQDPRPARADEAAA